jgi:hypothetical protein
LETSEPDLPDADLLEPDLQKPDLPEPGLPAAPQAEFDLVAEAVPQDLWPDTPPDLPLTDLPGVEESPELADAMAAAQPASLAGLAARLRALARPLPPEVTAELLELQMRLGLLHAQMIEAQRPRR